MKVLLTTLHSKYAHSSLALPCLAAICRDMEGVDIVVREQTVNEGYEDVLGLLLKEGADVVAFSCYIWNIERTLKLAADIRKESSESYIILGGPEVSYDAREILEKNPSVDCIVKLEGEATFSELIAGLAGSCGGIPKNLPGIAFRSEGEIIDNMSALLIADLDDIPSPFAATLVDIDKPLVYCETSRGCPFTCAFCLSSLDSQVRSFSMARIKSDLKYLMDTGVKTVKFVDRTFNYNAKRANEIWEFILENNKTSRFHFEIAADLVRDENIFCLKNVPDGIFRLEIGVQSIAEETLESVGRKSDSSKLLANIGRLLDETNVHIHLDLVAGLPGEDCHGFLDSLERLFLFKPHHIQVEPLKVLKGSPMEGIAKEERYEWSDRPPYRIEKTPWLAKEDIELIDTIGRLLELVHNSGRFRATLQVISESMPLSALFNGLAKIWRQDKMATLPMEALFGFIWDFVENNLSKKKAATVADALTFDRCMADYPNLKKMPGYFNVKDGFDYRRSKREIIGIRKRLKASRKSKVRALSWCFERDYREGGDAGGVELLFVYISTPGAGQEVRVMTAEGMDS